MLLLTLSQGLRNVSDTLDQLTRTEGLREVRATAQTIDLLVYGEGAVTRAISAEVGAANGHTRFSLGMAPLTGLAEHRLAGRWNRFANLVARHGERFYGFGGLRRFKSKFAPEWRPRYLAAPGGMHLPAALLDVTRLISLDPRRQSN